METTFITIHDLSLDARILYVSTSIEDILGYMPQDVIGKSCWDYFHPDEIPFARAIHGRGVQLDKAAVLNYCQIKNRDGRWVGCECVFTIVHDVMIGCTSVYRRGLSSQKRATEAPIIRRMFSSSPRDPRYHMLSYISQKFSKPSHALTHEPRAALFLNRFSRTLTIMYATNGLADAIGISANELCGKSFYYCIQENCLREAVKCLESAKANDSIAYLRFWFRDPRQDLHGDHDEHMSDGHSSGDEDDGGVHLSELMDHDGSENAICSDSSNSMRSSVERDQTQKPPFDPNSRSSSGNSTDLGENSNEAMFDQPAGAQQSRTSSISTPDDQQSSWSSASSQIEMEAVVSCTSDGLVVVLRRAKPFVPHISHSVHEPVQNPYTNGYFASPWASEPILPLRGEQSHPALPHLQQPPHAPRQPTAVRGVDAATKGPATEDFMNSIREVAVFAWALTGINGSLDQYSRGTPSGESQPPEGLPVWDPNANAGPENIERPIGGAYVADSHLFNDQKHLIQQVDSGQAHSDASPTYGQANGYRNYVNSNGLNHQMHGIDNIDQSHSHDAQREYCGNGTPDGGHNNSQRQIGNHYKPQAFGFHDSTEPDGSWRHQPQQERGWDPSQQQEQSSTMNGQYGRFG